MTVTGPKQTIVERRKERMLGIWTNMGSRTFLNVPSYLAVLSNQPLDQITDADTVRQLSSSASPTSCCRSNWAAMSATWRATIRSAPTSSG